MKKETFNLVVRFLVGLALSLLICAGMIMTGKLGSDKPLLQQASGLKGTETVMTVDGEPVESWEYLYMVTYSAQNLSYYGVTDLSTQLGISDHDKGGGLAVHPRRGTDTRLYNFTHVLIRHRLVQERGTVAVAAVDGLKKFHSDSSSLGRAPALFASIIIPLSG